MHIISTYSIVSLVRPALYVFFTVAMTACASLSYYQQAISGQMELLQKRRPIPVVLKDQQVDASVRARLKMIQEARAFAVRELLLPDNDSYKDYADLGRPYALWNVFVTPAFSLQPMQWCYPFVGCIIYRGYFSPVTAQAYADSMQDEGYDVYVAGVPAYSTLGWFDDPVMDTMMRWQDYDLVGTLFHELTHQKFYIQGDTVFNESLAKVVEQEGLRRWMDQHADSESYKQYLLESEREQQFIQLVLGTRKQLVALYSSELSKDQMFRAKLEIFRGLRTDYLRLSRQWDGYDAYDHWMLSGVNNAKVQSIATYYDYVPGFRKILQQQQGDLGRFYLEVERLMKLRREERREYLLGKLSD